MHFILTLLISRGGVQLRFIIEDDNDRSPSRDIGLFVSSHTLVHRKKSRTICRRSRRASVSVITGNVAYHNCYRRTSAARLIKCIRNRSALYPYRDKASAEFCCCCHRNQHADVILLMRFIRSKTSDVRSSDWAIKMKLVVCPVH